MKARHDLRVVLQLFARNAGPRLALGALLASVTVLAGVALLGISGWFITAAALAGATVATAVAFNIFVPSASIRLLALGRTAGRYFERVVSHDATLAVLAALRERLFRGWARPQAARALLRRPARLLFRLTGDIDALESIYLRLFVPAVAALGAAVLAATVLGVVDPRLGTAAFAWLLLVGWGVAFATMRRARPAALRRALALERVRSRAVDLVAGQTDLAMAGRLPEHCALLHAADERLAQADRQLNRLETRAGAAYAMAGSVLLGGVLLAAGALADAGRIDAPVAALALLVALAAMEPFAALRRGAVEAARSWLAARRLAPSLRGAEDVTSRTEPDAGCALRLAQVTAVHPGRSVPAVRDIDLELAAGARVAVVGPSGVGKSTLLAIAAGELEVLHGEVRAQPCAWLTQRTELFRDSLRDNLCLADPQADDARLWDVLHAAGLDDDVRRLERGLDTPLGEGGLGLSGGQARRLALARLLLRPSPLWLLDEPTEGLDAIVARDVLARLRSHATGRTLLIATHLRREAALADRILRVERGRLVSDARVGTPAYDAALRALRPD